MGGLTNLFIKDKKFKRTVNPIHSIYIPVTNSII